MQQGRTNGESLFNLPNLISILRIPLAFCFLHSDPYLRSFVVVLALITDGLDGFLARRWGQLSFFGTILDPLTDKFFVIFSGAVLIAEGRLDFLEAAMLISRDFAVLFFGCYLWLMGCFSQYRIRAIWCGKVTTVLQCTVLFGLIWGVPIASAFYGVFVVLGVMALVELYYTSTFIPSCK